MKRDVLIGVIAGVVALVVLGRFRSAAPVPPGVYQATLDVSKHREVLQALETSVEDARSSRRKLATRIEKFEVERMRLEDVITYLADASGVDIDLDWEALGLSRDEPVSVNQRDVTIVDALAWSFASFAGAFFEPAYAVEAGRLRITTRKVLERETVVRVYDLRDVLGRMLDPGRSLNARRVPPSTLPTFPLQPYNDSFLANSPAGSGGGGGGQFGVSAPLGDFATYRVGAQDELMQFLKETVDPESWNGVNGREATARWFQGVLIVSQTPSNHEEIAILLDWMREVVK